MLPREARERTHIAQAMLDVMSAWGYGAVETPVAEEYAVLQAGVGKSLEGTAFPFFDADGQLLALRPEMTVPIARLAATRLRDKLAPHRLCYHSDVFREHASLRGQPRQFTQVGLELIGGKTPAGDAEIIAVLVEALRATGLSGFIVRVGTVEALEALIRVSGKDEPWRQAVLGAAQSRNLVAIDALAGAQDVSAQVRTALVTLPRIRGDRRSLKSAREVAGFCDGVSDALESLEATWELLEAAGVDDAVSIDFGTMRSFGYYTGMVLEVFAPQLGVAIGGGGRYDSLMSEFDSPMPAAGFAVGIERVHIALSQQDRLPQAEDVDAVLGGEASHAFAAARQLRESGMRVRQSLRAGEELVAEAAAFGAKQVLLATGEGLYRLDEKGSPQEPFDIGQSLFSQRPASTGGKVT